MVPTSENGGGSISCLRGGGGFSGTGSLTTTAGGGRREGEKIGRSRVTGNCVSGMPQSGLALCARSGEACGAATRIVVTGSAKAGDSGGSPAARASSDRSASSASPATATAATAAEGQSRCRVSPRTSPLAGYCEQHPQLSAFRTGARERRLHHQLVD